MSAFRLSVLLVALTSAPAFAADAEPGRGGELYAAIVAEDARLFGAFNSCDLKTLGSAVAEELKFYHDNGGLSVGRDTFVESVQKNVCGKFTRELVPGSVEVWPVPGYGAIETGTHKFVHPDRAREPDGIGKFLILWKQEGGRWVMAETFSYAHMEAPK